MLCITMISRIPIIGILSFMAITSTILAEKTEISSNFQEHSQVLKQNKTLETPSSRIGEDEVLLNLKQGPIIGKLQSAGDGKRHFYQVKGIPYAKAPVKDLRFMPPVPSDGWIEPRNGSWVAPPCPQITKLPTGKLAVVGDEDCLYLNVFTPKLINSSLPVLFYIHGGGFSAGSLEEYQPLPLLTKDIVLVVFQYRLGALGFLSTEDSILPGNMGMKDQIMALEWVRDNIQELGGNPDRVTIAGSSAGSLSVHFHTFSPYAQGLFHQAIMQSGMMPEPLISFDTHRFAARKIAHYLNCTDRRNLTFDEDFESKELFNCVKEAPVTDIISAPVFDDWRLALETLFAIPRVDGDYLPENPVSLLKKGLYHRVPLVLGNTKDEYISVVNKLLNNDALAKALKENFTVVAPLILGFKEEDDRAYMSKRVFYNYLGVADFKLDDINKFSKMTTDRVVKQAIYDATNIYANDPLYKHNIYIYEFHHRGKISYSDLNPSNKLENKYIAHGDDIQYFFPEVPPFKPLEREDDKFVGDIMVSMWTNFVRTGNPTPNLSLGFKWSPFTAKHPHALAITTSPYMINDAYFENREFWKNMPTEENKILYPERHL